MALRRVWYGQNVQFAGIPKCAVTSTCSLIGANIDTDWGEALLHGPIFTVVRDPVERFVSAWQEARRRNTTSAATVSGCLDQVERFGWFDEHFCPQSWYIEPWRHRVEAYFGMWRRDWTQALCDWLGMRHALPRLNRTAGDRVWPNESERARILALYQEDTAWLCSLKYIGG